MNKILIEEKEKLFKMGNVVDYITKPFDFDELVTTIKDNSVD